MSASAELRGPRAPTPRPNSFHYVPVRDVERGPSEPCPLRLSAERFAEHSLDGPPERLLWLRLKDRMRLCVSQTEDFGTAEIAAVKAKQLYLDKSGKLAPDDFRRDLVKLVLDAECSRCERFEDCARCFAGKSGDVFSRDDARVREIVAALSGDVLDVGAGEGPYAALLEPRVTEGRLRYVALEPDAERARVLASRMPWAQVVVGTLEALQPESCFDHALVIRSENHLPDPELALRNLVSRLRPGGTLLIADDEAFGLVRSREQAQRAESGPAPFEHYRNDSAADVHARLASLPLTLLERRDVTPESSTQWLLHYRKAEP